MDVKVAALMDLLEQIVARHKLLCPGVGGGDEIILILHDAAQKVGQATDEAGVRAVLNDFRKTMED